MCGIAGMIGPRPVADERAQATLRAMRNRGPDARGSYRGRLGRHCVSLLHSRLSIIDLDPRADQPFVADGCVLVFNGEIYNYLELKTELESRGHVFATESDTEVVVKAYREFGTECVGRFEGMWALALLDENRGTLVLSRDRFGEKPLYFATWGGVFYFGSEVKFIALLADRRPTIDGDHMRRYLVNGYKALYKRASTFFGDVAELPPATSVTLTGPVMGPPQSFWRLDHRPRPMTEAEALAGVRARLRRAVETRLRADVPVAFCLSGGVDSTALASIAVKSLGREITAFSIVDRDERYDESENLGKTVAHLGCAHHVARPGTDGFFERMADLVAYHDSPVATISYYVHSFLSEGIARAGFKVALSGTGADELFTGYYDHYGFWLAGQTGREDFAQLVDAWRGGYGRFVRNPFLQDPLAFAENPARRDHIYLNRALFNGLLVEPFDEDFDETDYTDDVLRNRMLNELHHESVPVILHEDDLNSMRWSVENRSPYLDSDLSAFLYSVPSEHLIRRGYAKSLLRRAIDGLAPADVIWDQRKRGFNASIDTMVDRGDPGTLERLMADGPIFDFVRRDAMEQFLKGDMSDNSLSKFLFSFISAKLFLESDLVAGRGALRSAA